MRVIKFRGMSLNGEWHYGNLAILTKKVGPSEAGSYISNSVGLPFAYDVRPETVGQFTGLLDKNGKEIYEGDILLCDDGGEYFPQEYSEEKDEYFPVGKYVVEWKGEVGYPAFDLKDSPCDDEHSICHCVEVGSVEVIGNKFENPELLGGVS